MKNFAKFYCLFIISGFNGYSQYDHEFIINGDFSQLNCIQANAQTAQGSLDCLQFWECRTKKVYTGTGSDILYIHSPDLWTLNFNPIIAQQLAVNVTAPTPHSGTNMVGMQPYELIQQQFESATMYENHFYVVSFYIFLPTNDPTWWQDNALEFWLATDRTKYANETDVSKICTSDYISYLSGPTHLYIGSIDLNLTNFPTGQWHQVVFSFLASSDISSYNWLGIDHIKPNYTSPTADPFDEICEGGYVFIDDISMKDACNSPCVDNKGPITITSNGGVIPNAMAATCTPWAFTVENAQLIQLNVFDRWGNNIVHNKTAYDVNGLRDYDPVSGTYYPDYEFGWVGNTSLPVAVYTYKLYMYACTNDGGGGPASFNGTITNIGDCSSPNTDVDIQNLGQIDCCHQNLYFENTTFSSGTRFESADQNIFLGNNSTPTYGPVTIDASANILFTAGQNIFVDPGELTIQPGAGAQFLIKPCINARYAAPKGKPRFVFSNDSMINTKINSVNNNINNFKVSVTPNPSSGIVTLNYDKNTNIDEIEVYSSDGSMLSKINWDYNYNKIDLSSLNNGVYYLKIMNMGTLLKVEKTVIVK